MEFKDYYKIMEVQENATADEIKKSYRRLARKYHPDVSKEAGAEDKFKELGEAYEVLKDPQKRGEYDGLRKAGYTGGQQFRPPPGWESSFGVHTDSDLGSGDFSDFFETLFGRRRSAGGQRGQRVQRGRDLRYHVDVSLEDAYAGATRSLQLTQPDGSSRTLNVKIPEGVQDGQQIRLKGQGAPGMGGASSGDLFLEIALIPHRNFKVDGKDVTLELPVAPWELGAGKSVNIPTLGGTVSMKLPATTKAGQRMRLAGKGLPGKVPGDQYVVIKLVMPQTLSAKARELLDELASETNFDPRKDLTGA
ncbi:MAG: DnaJ domain-containing protein [Gammaproteobacteria bacterium]|jgi:curved DNA-binding protein|nr:DnaJ domain-containing protein [Gammaproteobacteria bacterium]